MFAIHKTVMNNAPKIAAPNEVRMSPIPFPNIIAPLVLVLFVVRPVLVLVLELELLVAEVFEVVVELVSISMKKNVPAIGAPRTARVWKEEI